MFDRRGLELIGQGRRAWQATYPGGDTGRIVFRDTGGHRLDEGVGMALRNSVDQELVGETAPRVFGEPYQTPDGATIVPVVRVGASGTARPIGIFVVRDGKASWHPAIDAAPIAVIGALTGFAAAAFATLAMVRRPPWPDVSIRVFKTGRRR